MRKLIIVAAALAVAGTGAATANDADFCAVYAKAAEQAMELRQLDYPMSKISSLKEVNKDDPQLTRYQAIMISAYDERVYQTEVERQVAIRQYREGVRELCLNDWK